MISDHHETATGCLPPSPLAPAPADGAPACELRCLVWYRMLGRRSGSSSRGAAERSQPADLAAPPGQLLCGHFRQRWAGRMGLLPGAVLAAGCRHPALHHGDNKPADHTVQSTPLTIMLLTVRPVDLNGSTPRRGAGSWVQRFRFASWSQQVSRSPCAELAPEHALARATC